MSRYWSKSRNDLAESWHSISTKIRLTKALVWPVARYGCESWTLKKDDETGSICIRDEVSQTAPKDIIWMAERKGLKCNLVLPCLLVLISCGEL